MRYRNCPRPMEREAAAALTFPPAFSSACAMAARSISSNETPSGISRRTALPSLRTRTTRSDAIDSGMSSGEISSPAPASRTARSQRFTISLTLPGQGCRSRPVNAAALHRSLGFPCFRAKWRRKCSRSCAISPGRSRSGGIRILITWSRWNRSSRNRPGARLLLEVLLRGGDHADVDFTLFESPHAPIAARVEELQDLRLYLRLGLRHLVQKEGPGIGQFEQSRLRRLRVREGALLVPEELRFKELTGQGGAVDLDEGRCDTWALAVDRARERPLARARLSLDQDHGARARGRATGEIARLAERWSAPDQIVEAGEFAAA